MRRTTIHRNGTSRSLNITWRVAIDVEQQRTASVLSHPERTTLGHQREAFLKVTPMAQEHLLKKYGTFYCNFQNGTPKNKQTSKQSRILKNSDMSFCRCLATGGKNTAVVQLTMLQSVKNAQPVLVAFY